MKSLTRTLQSANGFKVVCDEVSLGTAASDRPDLVFLHGTGLVRQCWLPIAESLLRQNVAGRAILFDMALMGESAALNHNFANTDVYAQYLADLEAVLDSSDGSRRVVLVGHSLGALTSLRYVETLRMASPSIIAVVAIEPILQYFEQTPEWLHRLRRATERRSERWPSREDAQRFLREAPAFQGWDRRALAQYLEHALEVEGNGTARLRTSRHVEMLVYDEQSRAPSEALCNIGRITRPICLVAGSASDIFTTSMASTAARLRVDAASASSGAAMTRTYVQTINGGGHLLPFTHVYDTVAVISKFVQRIATFS